MELIEITVTSNDFAIIHILIYTAKSYRSTIERIEMLTDEYRYKILKLVEVRPEISQRELASELGISLGKANFCLKALIQVGLVKATNFRSSKNKLAYMYLLTPAGIEEKAKITIRFLANKMDEYEILKQEITSLKQEIKDRNLFNNSSINDN